MSYETPWHRESYDRLIFQTLPLLLADRLPLAGYNAEPAGNGSCRVQISFAAQRGYVDAGFDLPYPDTDGLFVVDGAKLVVVPVADRAELEQATIRCAGELLHDYLSERVGDAPATLQLDRTLLQAWLPLDEWIAAWLADRHNAALLDTTDWLARITHLRRIRIAGDPPPAAPGQIGRACPFETPEGPNIGRILHLAVGATIRESRIVVADESPAAALGASASMVPFIEHSEPARLLMGTNMMRQWLLPPDPEPALVRSGAEPDAPDFWAGRNLLTAWIPWADGATFEDGIVVSESAARRLDYPEAAVPGDKLSTRHGVKGVISRILPDAEMPRLADGTPVELVYSSLGLISRLNFGQLRETVMGRIAAAEGRPAIVRPFEAPGDDMLRERLLAAGLAEDGMERLQTPDGSPLARRSTVGPVYWGKLYHRAVPKLQAWINSGGTGQDEADRAALHAAGADATVDEHFNTLALGRDPDLVQHAAEVPIEPAGPPAPKFAALTRKLSAGGIETRLDGNRISWAFRDPDGDSLTLAESLPHPWLRDRQLVAVGAAPDDATLTAVDSANERLRRMRSSAAPASLLQRTRDELRARVSAYFDALLRPEDLRFAARTLFSGRGVAAPGPDLAIDEVALPEELAWQLFGPLAVREVGATAVAARDERATAALDAVLARSWVVVHRGPALTPTAFVSLRPRRTTEPAIGLPLPALQLLDVDFDGDLVAVFLPLTEAGMRDAAERLSIAGHLRRDPELAAAIAPRIEALWGLAWLSLDPAGAAWLEETLGMPVLNDAGFTDKLQLGTALRASLASDGIGTTLERVAQLWRRGLAEASRSGVSISPFFGAGFPPLPAPEDDDARRWSAYTEERLEQLRAIRTLDDDLGVMLLSSRSGARGNGRQILRYLGPRGLVTGADDDGTYISDRSPIVVRHGYREGLPPGELFALAEATRFGIAEIHREIVDLERQVAAGERGNPAGVLARARAARHPGIVFARAAESGEVDRLVDQASRAFVGLLG